MRKVWKFFHTGKVANPVSGLLHIRRMEVNLLHAIGVQAATQQAR